MGNYVFHQCEYQAGISKLSWIPQLCYLPLFVFDKAHKRRCSFQDFWETGLFSNFLVLVFNHFEANQEKVKVSERNVCKDKMWGPILRVYLVFFPGKKKVEVSFCQIVTETESEKLKGLDMTYQLSIHWHCLLVHFHLFISISLSITSTSTRPSSAATLKTCWFQHPPLLILFLDLRLGKYHLGWTGWDVWMGWDDYYR